MATENDWFMKQVKECSQHDWYNAYRFKKLDLGAV